MCRRYPSLPGPAGFAWRFADDLQHAGFHIMWMPLDTDFAVLEMNTALLSGTPTLCYTVHNISTPVQLLQHFQDILCSTFLNDAVIVSFPLCAFTQTQKPFSHRRPSDHIDSTGLAVSLTFANSWQCDTHWVSFTKPADEQPADTVHYNGKWTHYIFYAR